MLYQLSYARVVVAYCSTVSLSLATVSTYALIPFTLAPDRTPHFVAPDRMILHGFAP